MTDNANTVEALQWADIYIRDNFSDTGLYPAAGPSNVSPDIIPAGTQPVLDPYQYITEQNWNKDFGGTTFADLPNYIYLRCKNLGANKTRGRLYLYYSPASLLLWPTDPDDPAKGWSNNPLKTSDGAEYVEIDIDPNALAVTTDPFFWIARLITYDYYSLIGRVVTDANPNPIPATFNTITAFAAYISDHPNMAWRNVTTITPSSPVATQTVSYSQGKEGGNVYFLIVCTNTPDGSAVELSSGTPGPIPLIAIPKTIVQNSQRFVAGCLSAVPADFQTDITFSWYSDGKSPLPGMTITLEALMPTPAGHELYARAATFESLGIPAGLHPQVMHGIAPVKAIRLGSSAMESKHSIDPPILKKRPVL